MNALQLQDLTVERGGRAVVKEVSVEIPAGEVTALLGPNGAGKSTLVLAVGGVLRPKAGSVMLGAPGQKPEPITGQRPERIRQAGVAIVPEGRRLLPDLTVEDNLRVASYALSRERAQAGREQVLELFPQLSHRLAALARTLSGGEQQMVVLAQGLISQPRYMLIDELSLGLAPVVVSRLIPVIRTIAEGGTGVLLIEQFATVALGLANHAHIMEGGRIRFSGPASELRANPELLQSAYLLRGSPDQPAAAPPPPAVIPDLFRPNAAWYHRPPPASTPGLGLELREQHTDIGTGTMAYDDTPDSQSAGNWPQVRSGPLLAGGILIGIGAVVAMVGVAVAGTHLAAATRSWIQELETPPGQLARLKWEQAKAAAASGTATWRDHPNAKVGLARRGSSS